MFRFGSLSRVSVHSDQLLHGRQKELSVSTPHAPTPSRSSKLEMGLVMVAWLVVSQHASRRKPSDEREQPH